MQNRTGHAPSMGLRFSSSSEYWPTMRLTDGSRMGVNARNFEAAAVEPVRIRRLDGASTWKYLD